VRLAAVDDHQDRDARSSVLLRSDLRRPRTALRSTRFHGAGPGLNSILESQDAFQLGGATKQSSERPNAKQAARIRGFVDRLTPAGDASRRFCRSLSSRRR
jgi:hypothetical protein